MTTEREIEQDAMQRGYKLGLEAGQAEIERLRGALDQCRGMAFEGAITPNAAYRWCERIEEVCCAGQPMAEYAEWSHLRQAPTPPAVSGAEGD